MWRYSSILVSVALLCGFCKNALAQTRAATKITADCAGLFGFRCEVGYRFTPDTALEIGYTRYENIHFWELDPAPESYSIQMRRFIDSIIYLSAGAAYASASASYQKDVARGVISRRTVCGDSCPSTLRGVTLHGATTSYGLEAAFGGERMTAPGWFAGFEPLHVFVELHRIKSTEYVIDDPTQQYNIDAADEAVTRRMTAYAFALIEIGHEF